MIDREEGSGMEFDDVDEHDPDDEDDVNTCEACGETDAVAPVKMPIGGDMTATVMICQFCGHVEEDDEP
jgi:hypothetical protein